MLEPSFDVARKHIEDTLASLGVDPAKVRVKDAASEVSWSLKRGSASVLVSLQAGDESARTGGRLRIAASVMIAPAEPVKRAALYERLLELNASLLNAAFAIVGDRVIAVSERPTAGLDPTEVAQALKHLSAVADTYDDRLVAEFGGKRASDA